MILKGQQARLMKIEKWVLGELATNCYVVKNEEKKELVIIDPATCPQMLFEHLREDGYQPKAILLTHGHFDHVMGIEGLVKEFQIPVRLIKEETEVLADASLNLSSVFGSPYTYTKGEPLEELEVLEYAGISFQVIHTPGHTKGGACYYVAEEETLFSGDTLFCQSVGRTDFPTGSMSTLVRSIKERLFVLPPQTKVYPGHGDATTIEEERYGNPYVV